MVASRSSDVPGRTVSSAGPVSTRRWSASFSRKTAVALPGGREPGAHEKEPARRVPRANRTDDAECAPGSPPARSPPRGAPFRSSAHGGSGQRAARRGRRGRTPARPRRPRSRRPFAVWAVVALVALVACVALVALVAFVALSALVACVAFTALVAFSALVALSAVFACFTLSEGASLLTSVVSAFASLCFVRTTLVVAYDVPPSARNSAISEMTNAGLGALNRCLNIENLRGCGEGHEHCKRRADWLCETCFSFGGWHRSSRKTPIPVVYSRRLAAAPRCARRRG